MVGKEGPPIGHPFAAHASPLQTTGAALANVRLLRRHRPPSRLQPVALVTENRTDDRAAIDLALKAVMCLGSHPRAEEQSQQPTAAADGVQEGTFGGSHKRNARFYKQKPSPTCPPDRSSKILLVQVGTLSSSHPSFGVSVFFLSFLSKSLSISQQTRTEKKHNCTLGFCNDQCRMVFAHNEKSQRRPKVPTRIRFICPRPPFVVKFYTHDRRVPKNRGESPSPISSEQRAAPRASPHAPNGSGLPP